MPVTASSKGQPVQILRFEKGELKLNVEPLQDILALPSVQNLPVVVVSIAGKMRHGKSLLLSNFVRYLQLQGRADWLRDAHGPLEGFVWKGGSTGVTTGVYIWSELFVVELPSTKKVAVMLMDTQGSFDTRGDVKESAVVFALSTMISSMQIYNIKGQLAGDDLLHLQMFTEYGKLAQQFDNQGTNPFQSLQILIRDWVSKSEAAFGFDGGMKHLNKVLDVECQGKASTQELVKDIKSSFNSIECFLMPEPKSCVRNGEFEGIPSTMGAAFTEQLQKFVPHILHPGKLVVKQQAGREIKTGQLLHQFQSLAKIFNSKDVPTPHSMLQANAEANYLIAVDEAMLVYRRLAESEFNVHTASFTDAHLKSLFENCRRAAVDEFTKTPKMGGDDMAKKFKKILEEKIEQCVSYLKDVNIRRIEEERLKKEAEENHKREVRELEDRHKKETMDALERAREEDRQMLLAKEQSHQENIERMQKEFQERYQQMTAEERQRTQEVLDKTQQDFKEQAQLEKEDADRRLKEIQDRAEENLKKVIEESNKNLERIIASIPRPTDNSGFFGKLLSGLVAPLTGALGGVVGRGFQKIFR